MLVTHMIQLKIDTQSQKIVNLLDTLSETPIPGLQNSLHELGVFYWMSPAFSMVVKFVHFSKESPCCDFEIIISIVRIPGRGCLSIHEARGVFLVNNPSGVLH